MVRGLGGHPCIVISFNKIVTMICLLETSHLIISQGATASMSARLAKVAETQTPGKMAEYHRQLARIGVARVGMLRQKG